jgi:hypothetical protein
VFYHLKYTDSINLIKIILQIILNNGKLTILWLTENTKGQVMRLPDFPAAAPELPPAGELYAERAVLTEGVVQASSILTGSGAAVVPTAGPTAAPANAQKQGGSQQQAQKQANPAKKGTGAI